jgi:glutamyl/glutaminyl-tRNA synthetase
MQISHIIRGDDHVSNTPKQILLYNAFEFELSQFAHVPMILGPDRMRLSKRHGATSIDEYQAKGYLPQALINYLSLLSWSSISGDEILSIERLIEEFDFKRISKSAAIFDVTKLSWMNGCYIRDSNIVDLTHLAIPYFKKAGYDVQGFDEAKKIITLLQDKIEYLEQIIEHAKIFFQDQVNIDDHKARMIIHKESSQKVLWSLLRALRSVEYIDVDIFRSTMKAVQKESGIMGKDLWMPVRIALTGKMHGPELPGIVELLGKEKCEKFVEKAVGAARG